MEKRHLADTAVYEIRVSSLLGSRWAVWFEGMTLDANVERCETTLRGVFLDQAALHGVFNGIRDLALSIIEVKCVVT